MFATASWRIKQSPPQSVDHDPPLGLTPPKIAPLPPDECAALRASFARRRCDAAEQVLVAIDVLRRAVTELGNTREAIHRSGGGFVRKAPGIPYKEALVSIEIAAGAILENPTE